IPANTAPAPAAPMSACRAYPRRLGLRPAHSPVLLSRLRSPAGRRGAEAPSGGETPGPRPLLGLDRERTPCTPIGARRVPLPARGGMAAPVRVGRGPDRPGAPPGAPPPQEVPCRTRT